MHFKVTIQPKRIPLAVKIKALADIFVQKMPAELVLGAIYAEHGRDLPSQTSLTQSWPDQIQKAIDSGNTEIRDLAIQEGIVEKVEDIAS